MKTRFAFVIVACVGLLMPAAPLRSAARNRLLTRAAPMRAAAPIRAATPLRAATVRGRSQSGNRLLTRAAPPRAAAPPLSNVRHRGPNPAVIASSTDVSKRNTGALDGKQVHRRP